MALNIEVTLDIITCYRGHVYAIPDWTSTSEYGCPMCLMGSLKRAYEREDKLQRTIRGLRGENTKLRGRI